MFAIYRYIVALEMLAPLLIVGARSACCRCRGAARYLALAVLCFACLVTARSDFLERAPINDPYVQAALPPIAHPDQTMVLMTGDAPLGFIAPSLPPAIPVLRIDGWMVQPRDGTEMTQQMKEPGRRRIWPRGGDLYLIADATDMGRARDALGDYRPAHPLAGMPAIRHQHHWRPINCARCARNDLTTDDRASPSWCPATTRKPPSPRWCATSAPRCRRP